MTKRRKRFRPEPAEDSSSDQPLAKRTRSGRLISTNAQRRLQRRCGARGRIIHPNVVSGGPQHGGGSRKLPTGGPYEVEGYYMTDACIFIRPKMTSCCSTSSRTTTTWSDGILPKAAECETLLLWQNGALTWEPLSYNLDNIHIAQYVRTLDPGQRPEDYHFPRGFRTSRERSRRTVQAARKRAEGLHPSFFDGEGGDDGDLAEKKNEGSLEEEVREEDGDATVVVVASSEHDDDDDDSMTTIAVPSSIAPILQAILRSFTLTPRPGPSGVSHSAAPSPLPSATVVAASPSYYYDPSPPLIPPNNPAPPPPLMTPDSDAKLADDCAAAAQLVVIAADYSDSATTFSGFSDVDIDVDVDDDNPDMDDDDDDDDDDDTPGPNSLSASASASDPEEPEEYFSPQYFAGLEAATPPPGSPSRGFGCTGW